MLRLRHLGGVKELRGGEATQTDLSKRLLRARDIFLIAAAILTVAGLMGDLLDGVEAKSFVWPLALAFAWISIILGRLATRVRESGKG